MQKRSKYDELLHRIQMLEQSLRGLVSQQVKTQKQVNELKAE